MERNPARARVLRPYLPQRVSGSQTAAVNLRRIPQGGEGPFRGLRRLSGAMMINPDRLTGYSTFQIITAVTSLDPTQVLVSE